MGSCCPLSLVSRQPKWAQAQRGCHEDGVAARFCRLTLKIAPTVTFRCEEVPAAHWGLLIETAFVIEKMFSMCVCWGWGGEKSRLGEQAVVRSLLCCPFDAEVLGPVGVMAGVTLPVHYRVNKKKAQLRVAKASGVKLSHLSRPEATRPLSAFSFSWGVSSAHWCM